MVQFHPLRFNPECPIGLHSKPVKTYQISCLDCFLWCCGGMAIHASFRHQSLIGCRFESCQHYQQIRMSDWFTFVTCKNQSNFLSNLLQFSKLECRQVYIFLFSKETQKRLIKSLSSLLFLLNPISIQKMKTTNNVFKFSLHQHSWPFSSKSFRSNCPYQKSFNSKFVSYVFSANLNSSGSSIFSTPSTVDGRMTITGFSKRLWSNPS